MMPCVMTGDIAGDLRRGCFFGNLSEAGRELLASAIEIADEASINLIECHGLAIPQRPGWLDLTDEPVADALEYLFGRGLIEVTGPNCRHVRILRAETSMEGS